MEAEVIAKNWNETSCVICESKMGLGMFYMKSWEVNRQ